MKFLQNVIQNYNLKNTLFLGVLIAKFLFIFPHQIATSDFYKYKRKIKKWCFISGLWPDLAKYSYGWTPLRLHKKILERLLPLLREFVGLCVCMCVFFLFLWWIFNFFLLEKWIWTHTNILLKKIPNSPDFKKKNSKFRQQVPVCS
jgi:hypothetical protein